MKKLLFILSVILCSCASEYDRVADCKSKYPNAVVTPSTGMIKNNGYELTVEDTLTNQIYAVSYYPFSTTKIYTIVNIR